MYTWKYIKNASLAKLDLDEQEAQNQNLINRFYIYANEVITQVCSTYKPKHTYFTVTVENKQDVWSSLTKQFNVYDNNIIVKPHNLSDNEKLFWEEFETHIFPNMLVTMPEDFISFGDDVNSCQLGNEISYCSDEDFSYKGYNQLMFMHEGVFTISYNARWITFTQMMKDTDKLNVPTDILECIPSYIASQCYKIDDEYKSSVFRNEYELFLSRIDDSNYKNTKSIVIGGDW